MSIRRSFYDVMLCGLLLYGCVLSSLAQALDARAYWPAPEPPSPTLWWAIDTSTADVASATRVSSAEVVSTLQYWLAKPEAAHRPYPQQGLRLGLMALLPDATGTLTARVVHPPLSLNSEQQWPAQVRHRRMQLVAGSHLWQSGRSRFSPWAQPWDQRQTQHLEIRLPFPLAPEHSDLLIARITLPVLRHPTHWPLLRVELLSEALISNTCASASICALNAAKVSTQAVLIQPEALADNRVTVDLMPALKAWQYRLGDQTSRSLVWRITPMASTKAQRGVWKSWTAQQPATWEISWRDAAHRASGRLALQRQLHNLFIQADTRTNADKTLLDTALQRVNRGQWPFLNEAEYVSGDDDCLGSTALLFSSVAAITPTLSLPTNSPLVQSLHWQIQREPHPLFSSTLASSENRIIALTDLVYSLDHWRDLAFAPAVIIQRVHVRQPQTALQRLDIALLAAVPGYSSWLGNLKSFTKSTETNNWIDAKAKNLIAGVLTSAHCSHIDACDIGPDGLSIQRGGLYQRLQIEAKNIRWLSDADVANGQPLRDWRKEVLRPTLLDSYLAKLQLAPQQLNRDALTQALQNELSQPVLAAAGAGQGLYISNSNLTTNTHGQQGSAQDYFAWPTLDGSLFWLDAATGKPLMVLRPETSMATWLAFRQGHASTQPMGLHHTAWALWPRVPMLNAPSQPRLLFGIQGAYLLAYDISDGLKLRRQFQPQTLPGKPLLGSLTLLTLNRDGVSSPVILVGRAHMPQPLSSLSANQSSALALIDGLTGRLLWQVGAMADHGVSGIGAASEVSVSHRLLSRHEALLSAWHSTWPALTRRDGAQLLYGLDINGRVWRLHISPEAQDVKSRPINLQLIADFAAENWRQALATGVVSFPHSPSLTWLRQPQSGQLYPAISLSEGITYPTQQQSGIYAFLDTVADLPTDLSQPLTRDGLSLWTEQTSEVMPSWRGWWRPWSNPAESATATPRWFDQRVLVTTTAPSSISVCGVKNHLNRAYDMPWQGRNGRRLSVLTGQSPQQVLSEPVLMADGNIHWLGGVGLRPATTEQVVQASADRNDDIGLQSLRERLSKKRLMQQALPH